MVILKNCDFINNSSTPTLSRIFPNSNGDTLTLQISGANGRYYLEGRNNSNFEWCPLAGINLSDLTATKGELIKAGIYEFGIVGMREIRVRVEEVEGEVSIFGQMISTEET